jgi:processive 1,2-diacylglycerol beta-glucosyltransferase
MKILIATATAGGGHLQAAAALEEAWKKTYPKDTVRRIDILEFTPRLYRKAYAEGYVRVAEKAPELYAHAFRISDNPSFVRKITRLRRMSARWVARRFIQMLNRFEPDVLLCPHFLPIETMGALDEKGLKVPRPLTVCVITDFEAHALWMEPCVDLYCVAMEETKARLVARGVKKDKVIVTGIPVSQRFAKPMSQKLARKQLGLKTAPTLLVLGGGMGMGPLVETVKELDKASGRFQMMVVAGRNPDLGKKLAAQRFRHPVKIFGFVTHMQELMAASDVLVTKPGGLTTSEALALGKPLLIVNPLPGQEAANSDFLLERGAAIKANRLEDLSFRIERLLRGPQLERMRRAARKLGRPQAAATICQAVQRHRGRN